MIKTHLNSSLAQEFSGQVVERFIGIEQVGSTTAQSLKEAIDRLFL